LRTHILSRNVVRVRRRFAAVFLLAIVACSRLPTLTPDILSAAQAKWNSHKPESYHLTIQMTGDRVETGRFEVDVQKGEVVELRRNGLVIRPNAGQDYTMDGLFRMIAQELGLAEKPATLGAPEGYSVYVMAKFDDATGRLIKYRRIVGGVSNSIEISVESYQETPVRN